MVKYLFNINGSALLPDTVRVGDRPSKVGVENALFVESRVVLVSPGPALTAGLVLDYYITEDYKCRLC